MTINILQKHHPPTPLNLKGSADSKIVNLLNINNLHLQKSADPSSQADRKVLAKLKYSVIYKAESGFSILTEECLTFQTTSTTRKYGTPESPSTRNRGEEAYQGRRAHEPKGAQYQQVIITARAEPPQKWRVGTVPTQNFLIINVLQQYHRAELSPNIFQAFILHSGLVILLTKLHPSAWSILNDCRCSSSISVTSIFSPLSAINPELLLYSEPHESIPCEQAH